MANSPNFSRARSVADGADNINIPPTSGFADTTRGEQELRTLGLENVRADDAAAVRLGGALKDSARLAGSVNGVAQRLLVDSYRRLQGAHGIKANDSLHGIMDLSESSEIVAIDTELRAIATRVLNAIPARDRSILMRFYVRGEGQQQICTEMGLNENQFRLIKRRAKTRFANLLRQRIISKVGSRRDDPQ